MNHNAQLLAHAGAPSSRKNDDRYKAQMQAYLDLEPANISRLDVAVIAWGDQTELDVSETPEQRQPHHDGVPDPSLYLDDTQLAYSALESQLFTSTPAATGSRAGAPRFSQPAPTRATPARQPFEPSDRAPDSTSSRSSRQTPGIIVASQSQSSYLVSPFVTLPGKRLRSAGDDGCLPSAKRPRSQTAKTDNTVHSLSNRTTTTNETTSELPSSYSLSDRAIASLSDHFQVSENSATHPGFAADGSVEKGTQSMKQQLLEFTTRKVTGPIARDFAVSASNASRDANSNRAHPQPTISPSNLAVFRSLSMDILPPAPPAGIGTFETNITSNLQRLTQSMDVPKLYCPVSLTREIGTFDRGHWLVKCFDWPLQQQVDFWKYLESSIGAGKAGHSVWCTRDLSNFQATGNESANEEVDSPPSSSHGLGVVKVYCWGEVVKHVYLLLYVASGSKVRRLGLQWIDAEGDVVVQMRKAVN